MNFGYRSIVALITSVILLAPRAAAPATAAVKPADVLVIGGTPAGIAAAVAAARRGEHVTLVASGERLGGVLTDAMMNQWDLNLAPGGASIEEGIFGEIYARLGDAFLPAAAARTFAEFVARQARISVRYDELPVAIVATKTTDGARVDAVTFVDTRTGARTSIEAGCVVDATDSADVAVLAGARYDVGRQDTGIDERAQAVTQMFTLDGVDWDALADSYAPLRFGAGGVSERRAWGYAKLMRAYRPTSPDVVVRDLNFGLLPGGSVAVNAVDVFGIDGLDSLQLQRARRLTQVEAVHLVAYLRARVPGFARARVGTFAPDVYVRETRHVLGLEQLTARDIWFSRIPRDSIGLSSYPIDLHPVDAVDRPAYAPIRHVYGIPFGALVPRGLANVILAGPAISATHLASGSVRVVPSTIEEGEAAGVASALALRAGIDFAELAGSAKRLAELRGDLTAGGVLVDVSARVRSAAAAPADRRRTRIAA